MSNWLIVSLMAFLAAGSAAAQTRPVVPRVSREQGKWTIQGESRTLKLDPGTLAVDIASGPTVWKFEPAGREDLIVESEGHRLSLNFLGARKVETTEWSDGARTGLRIAFSEFPHSGKPLDFSIRLFVCMDHVGEELTFDVVATEGEARVRECRWPRAFEPAGLDRTVVPYMQGMLLPGNWPRQVRLYDDMSYGRGLYMPWWGHEKAGSAAIVILETPDDGGCRFEHPAGGPTRIQTRWVHSLGRLAYARRARVAILDRGNYADLAKRYRRYVVERGRFVSLREKFARSPIVARLIGSPVLHTSILYHIQPDSNYYKKDRPAENHQLVTFDARAEELRKLHALGVERLYVHLDGWGLRGYDNLHPDILPPCPEAGGWDGMRRLADTCDELGYVFAVHDQYRDYYHDAASYNANLTILDEKGNRPFGTDWFGGKQSILCPSFAPGHVAKNHRAILAQGVKLRGAYLDVFAVVPPDECYNSDHPVTRSQCLAYRSRCLDLIRALEGVVSSEEPADWAIPHIDLVHHAPFALDPNPGAGEAFGVPVPLHALVYHDALVTPWSLSRGGWGIPKQDSAYLHGLACAGVPYTSTSPGKEEMEKVRTMAALHQRVGLLAMTGHELLDATGRRYRTRFADGTTVTVDHDKDSFEIVPPLSAKELSEALKRRTEAAR